MTAIQYNNMDALRTLFISDTDYEDFIGRLRTDKKIAALTAKVRECDSKMDFCGGMRIRKQIEDEARKMVERYIQSKTKLEEKVALSEMSMSEEDKNTLAEQSVSICMCCDFIESFCMNIDEIMKRYGDYELTQFLELNKLLKKVRGHLRWIQDETVLRDHASWGVACDFYIESIPKRARKLMKTADNRKKKD